MLLTNILAAFMMIVVLLMLATAMINLFIRVPYVPSKMRVVKKVIEVADLKTGEHVYDLGCGDGRLLLEAEKKAKIMAEGYEAAPIPYLFAQIKKLFHHSRMHISMRNFFKVDLKNADVIFCYLGPETMTKLAEKFKKECKKGTRIISHTFHLEGFTPTKVIAKNSKLKLPTIYLYQI